MRKLFVIAHSLYKNDCAYDAEVYKKACGVKIIESKDEEFIA